MRAVTGTAKLARVVTQCAVENEMFVVKGILAFFVRHALSIVVFQVFVERLAQNFIQGFPVDVLLGVFVPALRSRLPTIIVALRRALPRSLLCGN
jgi:hypothetical protein